MLENATNHRYALGPGLQIRWSIVMALEGAWKFDEALVWPWTVLEGPTEHWYGLGPCLKIR